MWVSRHEELVSNGVVSPHVCDPMVVPHGWAVLGSGKTHRGQQGTPALTLPHMRDGLSMLLTAVLCPFRRPLMCRPVHRPFLRNKLLDLTTSIPTTPCYQRNYVEPYSRFIENCRFLFKCARRSMNTLYEV